MEIDIMLEKWVGETIAGLAGLIMVFFWNKQKSQDDKIKEICDSSTEAHNRITKQGERNNDKFARRDDVLQVEKRIIEQVHAGFRDLKEDIRASNARQGGEQ